MADSPPYPYPSDAQIKAYTGAVQSAGGGPMQSGVPLTVPTSNLGAPAAPKPRGGFRGFRQWLGITIMGADAGPVLFPPQQPLQPIAQSPDQFAIGRNWDYPVGYNTRVTPRDQQISFATLKNLATGYDVLAIMISRVKDKIVSQQWTIGPKDQKAKGYDKDKRVALLTTFFEYPDKNHTFKEWSRMLLDQVIMYDAPAIWLRTDRANRLYSLEIIDGAMITPKIGPDGRIPEFDVGPGYQQVIKGLPAVDYVKPAPFGMVPPPIPELGIPFPELLYKPRNPRVDSLYGYGPVEQIITTVNIALRREDYLLRYYTEGSTPDLLAQVPKEWNPDQIAKFQTWWDSILVGQLGTRRGVRFIPNGVVPYDTKEKVLTDATDEWLIRICCFALGLNPMPFVKQMNRGQEKTHHDEAAQEGLEPWLEWFATLINGIILHKFGFDDLIFRWKEDEATDEATRATIAVQYVTAKIYHPDEIRAQMGDEPMSPEMRDQMDMATFSSTVNATILPDDQQEKKDNASMALAAAKPAPVMAAPGTKPPPTQKSADDAAPVVNHFKFDAPQITIAPPAINIAPPAVTIAPAAVNVTSPPVTVNMPEQKQPDVFVDIGATNFTAKIEAPKTRAKDRTVSYTRDKNGNLVAKITDPPEA